jgi:hypothetical protein
LTPYSAFSRDNPADSQPWPGGEPSPLAQRIGNIPAPSTALNATDTIWQFFAPNHR